MAFFSGIVRRYKDFRTIRWLSDVRKAAQLYDIYRENPEGIKAAEEHLESLLKKADEIHIGNFHRGTGSALTTWAIMEARIVLIASYLLKTDPEKVGLIFYSIINFQVWLAIVTELFPLEPDLTKFQPRWNKIAQRLRAEKDFRDRLAHTPVTVDIDAPTLETRRALAMGNILDTRAKSRALKPMTVEQVVDFRNRVAAISRDLMELLTDMKSHAIPLWTSREKPTAPPPDPTG